jgi:hypothetical protein
MNQNFTEALYVLYPQIVRTFNDEAFDVEGNQVQYDPVAVEAEAKKLNCSAQAKTILQQTDWTSIADVGDPTKANPYLVNQAAFISYRSTVRNLAVNPVVDPVFPTAPTEEWSS